MRAGGGRPACRTAVTAGVRLFRHPTSFEDMSGERTHPHERAVIMRAHLGDQLVVGSPATGGTRRDGEIVGLHHEDGTPPYDVRWSDTLDVTLVFPGPDAHINHLGHEPATDAGAAPRDVRPDPGDIGRRVAAERERRGLTREETARRARMAPDYLAYLEERPGDPSLATLLSTHGVGRIAVATPEGPAVVPVNYEVVDDAIAFRTAPGSVPAAAVGAEVAFEVDHLDEAMGQGWSVLAVGPAQAVTAPDDVRRLTEHAHTTPWAGGEREMWVSIRPARLTGRRITPAEG